MPVHFSSLNLPSISAAFSNLHARFTAFTGRIKSALQSLKSRPLEPVRPLKTRLVQQATPPTLSPIKQLQQATSNPSLTKPVDLKSQLQVDQQRLHQKTLNEEIKSFDAKTLTPTITKEPPPPDLTPKQAMQRAERLKQHAEAKSKAMSQLAPALTGANPNLKHAKTTEKTGLEPAQLDQQLGRIQDNIKLHPTPLAPAKDPVKPLGEPAFADIKADFDQNVTQKALKEFADQVAVRLAKLDLVDRKSAEGKAIAQEIDQLADDLGRVLGAIYRGKSAEHQNAFAIALGDNFKAQMWDMLRAANPKLPDVELKVEPGMGLSPVQAFVNRVYNHAAAQFDTRIGEGPKPDLVFNGAVYTQKKVLGEGGGGKAYFYENSDGHKLVVKSKGFGKDDEEILNPVDFAASHHEFGTHLGLMKSGGDGESHILKMVGSGRTFFGQPFGVFELAERGDVDRLVGKTPPPGVDPKSLSSEEKGLLKKAVADGLVSAHAEKLVKLLVLQDAMDGMSFLQEHGGLRHGDFKPGNLFIGGDANIKVADFGESSVGGVQNTGHNVHGTPKYMAPEMFTEGATVSPKADTWSIGVFAHELFHGNAPFGHKDSDVKQMTADYVAKGGPSGLLGVSTLADNADPKAPVQGVSALDRFLNATFQTNPEDRPSLKEAKESTLFDDLRGHEKTVRELVKALTDVPQDRALIKAKSDALGR